MSNTFPSKKRKILEQLALPDQDYTDLSPKGSVDKGIRDLVREINQLDGFVTTSSCAGRVAVYLEGVSKRMRQGNAASDREAAAEGIASGGKGGGQWLYVSHDAVEITGYKGDGALLQLLGLPKPESLSCPKDVTQVQFIHLKYEPLILHILHASLAQAQQTLSAALSAGFRESGISSISPDGQTLVAVRTSGLAFDSIIGYADHDGTVSLMVTESYLRTLLFVANERFDVNTERKERFRKGLMEHVDGKGVRDSSNGQGWEPAEERRERKRAEGLRRKAELQEQQHRATVDGGAELKGSNEDLGLFAEGDE